MLINDPIHGMMQIDQPFLWELIDHSYFQRLRYIKQAGMANWVYTGAEHTRFAHSLGATFLMQKSLEILEKKGISIKKEDKEAVLAAILLHDIGHGPYSHTLEYTLIDGISHEKISELIIQKLNQQFGGRLELSKAIFTFEHPQRFLSQLVAGQIDMDRLDYLQRDSFYSGVHEATIGAGRLIDALEVKDNQLCIHEKAIYTVEQFLLARKIMYLQVYNHKAVIGVEGILLQILKRAKFLAQNGTKIFAPESLSYFLNQNINRDNFLNNNEAFFYFLRLSDASVFESIAAWTQEKDFILSDLSKRLLHRNMHRILSQKQNPFPAAHKQEVLEKIQKTFKISAQDASYYLVEREENFSVYNPKQGVFILQKQGNARELYDFEEEKGLSMSPKNIHTYFLGYPREIENE